MKDISTCMVGGHNPPHIRLGNQWVEPFSLEEHSSQVYTNHDKGEILYHYITGIDEDTGFILLNSINGHFFELSCEEASKWLMDFYDGDLGGYIFNGKYTHKPIICPNVQS